MIKIGKLTFHFQSEVATHVSMSYQCQTLDMHLIKNVGVVEFALTQISGLLKQILEN